MRNTIYEYSHLQLSTLATPLTVYCHILTVAAPGLGIWGGICGATRILRGARQNFTKSPLPHVANTFDPLDFFPYIFSEIPSRTFLIFFQTFKNCPGLPKFFTDLPKMFPRPTQNVIF